MSLFLDAASGKDTERAPIWLMRQAGRHLAEYRALKEKYTFWQLCRTPELAVEVTMQPIRRYGMDAAVMFSDIMTPLESMGVDIDFRPGPVIEDPIRSMAQVEALRVPDVEEIAPYVWDLLGGLGEECPVPVVGFAGAPLTLATYLVQGSGSKDYALFRQFLRSQPEAAHALLDKLTEVTIRYVNKQVDSGASAIQLFDSWAGIHAQDMYESFAAPSVKRVMASLAGRVPRIYLAVGSLHLYPSIAKLPMEVFSADWRMPLSYVRQVMPGRGLQGNLDPSIILAPAEVMEAEAIKVLRSGLGGAHIFNLGHGIMREASPDNVKRLVDLVQGFDRVKAAAEG